jgi:hypothetical protein
MRCAVLTLRSVRLAISVIPSSRLRSNVRSTLSALPTAWAPVRFSSAGGGGAEDEVLAPRGAAEGVGVLAAPTGARREEVGGTGRVCQGRAGPSRTGEPGGRGTASGAALVDRRFHHVEQDSTVSNLWLINGKWPG